MLKKGKIGRSYKKLVWGFSILSLIIILFVGYFAFANTQIVIYPAQIEETVDFQATLEDLDGEISNVEVEGEKRFSDFEATTTESSPGNASGIVTIYNNYSVSQPLVATTRLLSEEGILFRTQENVVVPKGGSIDTEVIADEKGEKGDIGPSKFEIVALNNAKKEFIYGESSEEMTGGITEIAILSDEDIRRGSEELSDELVQKGIDKLKESSDHPENIKENTIEKSILESEVSNKPGDTVTEIEIFEKIQISNISFDEEKLLKLATEKLEENLDMGTTITKTPTLDDIEYTVLSIDENGTNAVIKITVHGTKQINEKNSILDKSQILSKTRKSIQSYFNSFDEIEKVEVTFSPFWVQTSPLLEDQINFEIKTD